jgi:hypothetical protein
MIAYQQQAVVVMLLKSDYSRGVKRPRFPSILKEEEDKEEVVHFNFPRSIRILKGGQLWLV